jgi:hypothetical protein
MWIFSSLKVTFSVHFESLFSFKYQLYVLTRSDTGKVHPITGHERPEVE